MQALGMQDVDEAGPARGGQPAGNRLNSAARESLIPESQMVYVEASLPQVQGMLRELDGAAIRTAVLQAAVILPSGEDFPRVEELQRGTTGQSLSGPPAAEPSAAGSGPARPGRAVWVRPVVTDGMREGGLARLRDAEADRGAGRLRFQPERKEVVGRRLKDVANPTVGDVATRNEAAKEYYFGQLGISPAGPDSSTPVRVLIVLNDQPTDAPTTPGASGGLEAPERPDRPEDVD
jgi:hypothetical protein